MTITLGTTGRYEPGTRLIQNYDTMTDRRGAIRRGNKRPQAFREWIVPFKYLDSTELTAIVNEYNTAKGSAGVVNFVPPGFVYTIPVRFVEGSLRFEVLGPKHFSCTYRVREDVQI